MIAWLRLPLRVRRWIIYCVLGLGLMAVLLSTIR